MTAYRKGAAAVVLCDANPEARRARPWPASTPQVSPFTRKFLVIAADGPADPARGDAPRRARVARRIRRPDQPSSPRASSRRRRSRESTGVRVRVKGYDEVDALRRVVREQPVAQRAGEDRGHRPGAEAPGGRDRRAPRPPRVPERAGAPGRRRQRVRLGGRARSGARRWPHRGSGRGARSSSRSGAARRTATTGRGGSRPRRPTA